MSARILLLFCSFFFIAQVQAQQPPQLAESAAGEVFISPKGDLGLVSTPLIVPDKFKGQVPAGLAVQLPPGFIAKVFAAPGLEGPRFMAWDDDGVLHVANMKAGGGGQFTPAVDSSTPPGEENMLAQILALPDRDGDGVADTVVVAADGLWFPNSIDFFQGDLYVADMHQVVRLSDGDGDGYYEERQVVVPDLPVGHHRTRTLVFDQDQGKLYLSVGSSCDLCREDDERRATILQFEPDGSGQRVFARGLRNAVGMTLHPRTNELWMTVNGHDREGDFLPPERIDIVRDGGFYGWPIAHGFQTWVDFSISQYEEAILPLTAQDSLDFEQVGRPVAQVPAHTAPMGIHFYDGELFPSEYRDMGFVALRGRGRGSDIAYKVVAMEGGGEGEVVVSDFLGSLLATPGNANSVWGKPVGLTSDAAGNLYVSSDWINHLVLKITYATLRGELEGDFPGTVFAQGKLRLDGQVRLSGVGEGSAPVVTADLSALGGPADLALEAIDETLFALVAEVDLEVAPGPKSITIRIEQQTAADRLVIALEHELAVVPGSDLAVLGEGPLEGWSVEAPAGIEIQPPDDSGPVFAGATATPVHVADAPLLGWNINLVPQQPTSPFGYSALRFAFHPGDATVGLLPRLTLTLRPGETVDLLGEGLVDLDNKDWQLVEIPMERFAVEGELASISFGGTLEGTFYLDEMNWITATPRPPTAVVETQTGDQPDDFALAQNYPNPFNSGTAIGFAVPASAPVRLTVFNLAGQEVATLADGFRAAGQYTVQWDGRSGAGAELASGVYFYRLWVGDRVATRKLLLLR
ncbi:MAG: T9SS type A sorting domain-containing protein [Candidatus Latescibacteria bacterium]|nr:T9SS type A sorting domain-containing protein [Candidatus Latescibacterota bacterium]